MTPKSFKDTLTVNFEVLQLRQTRPALIKLIEGFHSSGSVVLYESATNYYFHY